jgi:hypothetical protein
MSSSKNSRISKGKYNTRNKPYRKPELKYKTKQIKKDNNQNMVKDKSISVEIDYALVLNNLLSKDDYSIHKAAKIQELALNEALIKFNAEPLIVPCEAEMKYQGPKVKPELLFHTRYQDVKKAIMDKLRAFELYFAFTSINPGIDEQSGMGSIQVIMEIHHKLGGKIAVSSKPVLVAPQKIDGIQLLPDKCLSSATTRAKKDVIAGSLLNVIVDMPECYKGELKQYTDDEWRVLSSEKVKELTLLFKPLPQKMMFLKHLYDNYNVRGIRFVRGFQFDSVKSDLENWEDISIHTQYLHQKTS